MPNETVKVEDRPELLPIRTALEANRDTLQALLPKHMKAETVIQSTLMCLWKTPELRVCTPESIVRGVIVASQLGLDCSGIGGKAWLVPFRHKDTGKLEAQFIPGYQGLLDIARRTGIVKQVEAQLVFSQDTFEVQWGTRRELVHRPPALGSKRGTIIGAYAIAVLPDGLEQFEVMDIPQLEAIRAKCKSQPAVIGEWYRKTALRRLLKYLPSTPELDTALEEDNHNFEWERTIDAQTKTKTLQRPSPPQRLAAIQEPVEASASEASKKVGRMSPGQPPTHVEKVKAAFAWWALRGIDPQMILGSLGKTDQANVTESDIVILRTKAEAVKAGAEPHKIFEGADSTGEASGRRPYGEAPQKQRSVRPPTKHPATGRTKKPPQKPVYMEDPAMQRRTDSIDDETIAGLQVLDAEHAETQEEPSQANLEKEWATEIEEAVGVETEVKFKPFLHGDPNVLPKANETNKGRLSLELQLSALLDEAEKYGNTRQRLVGDEHPRDMSDGDLQRAIQDVAFVVEASKRLQAGREAKEGPRPQPAF